MRGPLRHIRVLVHTERNTYLGSVQMPEVRRRVSDLVNEDKRTFLNLTDVIINDEEQCDFISINKNHIISITELTAEDAGSAVVLEGYVEA